MNNIGFTEFFFIFDKNFKSGVVMNNDDRVVELLTEMLFEQKGMKEELVQNNKNIMKLQSQQAKTNLAIGELRLSVMKLADRLEIIADHENRIDKLERAVFN